MNILYHSYEDLVNRISIIDLRLNSYKKEKILLKQLMRQQDKNPLSNKEISISYNTYLKELTILDGHILLHEGELYRLIKEKKTIDDLFRGLNGNEEQVFYHRVIKGLTQEKTAEKMYMSTRQVQRIEKKIKEKKTSC